MRRVLTYFSVEAPRSQEGGVEGVRAVGGHDHLHLAEGVKAIHLVQQLKHKLLRGQHCSLLTALSVDIMTSNCNHPLRLQTS